MAQRFLDREGILIVLLSGLSLVFLVAAGLMLWNPPADQPEQIAHSRTDRPSAHPADTAAAKPFEPVEYLLTGEDGVTALDLLKREHEVKLDSELLIFGSIILAIDTVEAKPDEVWTYYRDSIPGSTSPDVCTTFSGETIRWVLKQRR